MSGGLGSWDLLILVFLVLVSIGYTVLFVTRGKLLPLLVSTYMSFVLVEFAPFLGVSIGKSFGLAAPFEMKLIVFAVIFFAVLYVLSRVIFQSPVGAETFGILPSFVLSVAQTGFLLAVLISFLPREITQEFSNLTRVLFVGGNALFYWAVAPVVLLLILGRKANQDVG